MINKSSFDWQANTSESRKFWKENSKKSYWALLTDNSYKLIDLFIDVNGGEISGTWISESLSIPFGTTKRNIGFLKKAGILHSEKHIYQISNNIRSVANYAIISSGLVSLANHLQNLNIKEWRPSTDPFRSIMKKKSEIPSNHWERTVGSQLEIKNKNQLSICKHSFMEKQDEIPSNHWERTVGSQLEIKNAEIMNSDPHLKNINSALLLRYYILLKQYIYLEGGRSPGGPPSADPPCGAGENNPSGEEWRIHVFDHDGNQPTCQKIPAGSFPAAPDRNKKMENSLQKPQGGSIMNSFEQIAKNDQFEDKQFEKNFPNETSNSIQISKQIAKKGEVEDKHFEKNFPNETTNSIQIAKKGEFASSRPRPRLFVKVNDHGHASRTRQDASRGTKMKKTTLDMGFIKNELRIDSKQETRNVPNSGYEKFVDYWNHLSETKGYLPKCTKVRAGSPTKVFERALKFFKEFQNGKLFNHSRAFPLDDLYLDRIGVSNMRNHQFSDTEMFQIIENVATAYASNPTYLPKKFDAILWADRTNAAKRDGIAHSVFLELINSKPIKHLSLGNSYDDLSEKDQEYMEYHLIPMYKNLRGVHTEPPDAEMSQLISGFFVLRSQWEEKYQELCKNSISAKLGRIDPNFSWFVREFAHFVVDTGWKNLPLQIVFSLNQEYLGEYLNQLERNL